MFLFIILDSIKVVNISSVYIVSNYSRCQIKRILLLVLFKDALLYSHSSFVNLIYIYKGYTFYFDGAYHGVCQDHTPGLAKLMGVDLGLDLDKSFHYLHRLGRDVPDGAGICTCII